MKKVTDFDQPKHIRTLMNERMGPFKPSGLPGVTPYQALYGNGGNGTGYIGRFLGTAIIARDEVERVVFDMRKCAHDFLASVPEASEVKIPLDRQGKEIESITR